MSISSEFKEDAFSLLLLSSLHFIIIFDHIFMNKSALVGTCINVMHIHKISLHYTRIEKEELYKYRHFSMVGI